MSFLDKIGKACFAGLRYAAPFFGELAQANTIEPLHAIAGAVLAAEAMAEAVNQAGGSKLDKLEMVLPEATSALLASPLLEGKTVHDREGFKAGVTQIVNGIVQVLKSVDIGRPEQPPAPSSGTNATTESH